MSATEHARAGHSHALALALRFATALACLTWAAQAGPQAPMITDADIDDARRRHGGASAVDTSIATPAPVHIDALPQPLTKLPADLEAIARGYGSSEAMEAAAGLRQGPGLIVFISLSVPRPTLDRLLDQAARAGASVVLRGFVQGSLRATVAQLQSLIGQRSIAVQIDPPAFDRFAVTRVPSVVLVRDGARPVACANGSCAPPEAFVKIDGDVSLDYALEQMQRSAPAFHADAGSFLARLRP